MKFEKYVESVQSPEAVSPDFVQVYMISKSREEDSIVNRYQ